eukprot:TRINITY_DN39629_c0_g1_i1.p1 TRINITY_DN39629_c0_g1~~TRINITY_DN39629_c0_g1_i1.p1  ORF type:complete len:255 (+),score=46.13 TRINITY_DN39629_c0_g1_i1:63-767(+)
MAYVVDGTIQQIYDKVQQYDDTKLSAVDGENFSGIVWAMSMLKIQDPEKLSVVHQLLDLAFKKPEMLFKQGDTWSRFLFGVGAMGVELSDEQKAQVVSLSENLLEHLSRVDLVHLVHAFAQLQIRELGSSDLLDIMFEIIKSDMDKLKPNQVHELIAGLVMLRTEGGMKEQLLEIVQQNCDQRRKLSDPQKLSLLRGLKQLGCAVDDLEKIIAENFIQGSLSEEMMQHVDFGVV